MADLHNHTSGIDGVSLSDLLEVGMREVDVTDKEFLALRFDKIAHVVGMFREDEDAAGDEVSDGRVQGEAEAGDTRPEGFGVFDPVLVEEVAWMVC